MYNPQQHVYLSMIHIEPFSLGLLLQLLYQLNSKKDSNHTKMFLYLFHHLHYNVCLKYGQHSNY